LPFARQSLSKRDHSCPAAGSDGQKPATSPVECDVKRLTNNKRPTKMDEALKNTVIRIVAQAASLRAWRYKHVCTFEFPLTIDSPGVVGSAVGITGEGGGSIATVTLIAQKLLDLPADTTDYVLPIGDTTSKLNTSVTEYAATLTVGFKNDTGSTAVPAGWDYVIAKYDNQNAGYILYYLGGLAATLPTTGQNIFTQQALSGYTVFNPVPEPTTMIAGALLLRRLVRARSGSGARIASNNRSAALFSFQTRNQRGRLFRFRSGKDGFLSAHSRRSSPGSPSLPV